MTGDAWAGHRGNKEVGKTAAARCFAKCQEPKQRPRVRVRRGCPHQPRQRWSKHAPVAPAEPRLAACLCRVCHHEVDVQEGGRVAAQALHNGGSQGQVWHKMPVLYVGA